MTATTGNVYFVLPLVELVCKDLAHSGQRQRPDKRLCRRPTGRFKDFSLSFTSIFTFFFKKKKHGAKSL